MPVSTCRHTFWQTQASALEAQLSTVLLQCSRTSLLVRRFHAPLRISPSLRETEGTSSWNSARAQPCRKWSEASREQAREESSRQHLAPTGLTSRPSKKGPEGLLAYDL
jgi:hypothetical protein